MKTKVTLVEPISSEPFYCVSYYVEGGVIGHWSTAKVFTFRYGEEGIWSQEKNLRDAMDLAKRLETESERSEITIYETPTHGDEDQK